MTPPAYFYHLKFELYPYPTPEHDSLTSPRKAKKRSKEEEEERRRKIWLPDPDTGIFDRERWPRHKSVKSEAGGQRRGIGAGGSSEEEARSLVTSAGPGTGLGALGGGGAVIDCGLERASQSLHEDEPEARSLLFRKGNEIERGREFPTTSAANIQRDLGTAVKDWRFGRVRVEGFDMREVKVTRTTTMRTNTSSNTDMESQRPRGESSSEGARNGINAGLAPEAAGVGRVTKARYEVVESGVKNTEIGWGVVHLYRDGEETPGLGSVNTEVVYTAGNEGPNQQGEENEAEDCTTLCIPAVPSYLTPSDFLGFVGEKTREEVSHFRMVMTGRMNRYLVLMKFRDGGVARRWRKEWDGKVFNSMEPETCHVTFIKSITFQTPTSSRPNTSFPELSHDPFMPSSTSTFLKPFPPPTPNLVELPTCPVCLERMDDTSGLLTIPCQHVFHCNCLQKWKGSGCPVCRHTNPSLALSSSNTSAYSYDPANPPFGSGEASLCSVCDCTDDLWICLICGNVGCGRYKGGHAKEHWKDSAHNFALEIETQHVWDYAGDIWVHRLIRDKGDSKVIELPSSSRSGIGGGRGMSDDVEMVPRAKLEGIGIEYTHLLTSQLESQRVYFEELVGKAVSKASAAANAASIATARADEAISKLSILTKENTELKDTVKTLERDLEKEKKKGERSAEVARGFGRSLMEEKRVGEGLMERITFLNGNLEKINTEMEKFKAENAELKEENRDLLFSISAQQKLAEMGEGEGLEKGELEGGSLSLPPEKIKRKGKGRGK